MRLMNDVLRHFIDSFVIVYLDDILVYSATLEEHMSHLTQVLETLKKHQLLENLKKCKFSQQSLVYLGYVISGGELKIDPSKMQAIMKWSVPTNVSEVKTQEFHWGSTVPEEVHILIFSISSTTPRHNKKWQEFPMGKRSAKGFQGAKEEDQSSTSYGITKLAAAL